MTDDLDQMLDAALASYTTQEPRAGFDARIMARMEQPVPAPRWSWWAAAAATIALTGWAAIALRTPSAPPPITARPMEPATVLPATVSAEVARPPVKAPRAPVSSARRDSLTPEQRAWLEFARAAPEKARDLARPNQPLSIEAINIQPLRLDAVKIDALNIGAIE